MHAFQFPSLDGESDKTNTEAELAYAHRVFEDVIRLCLSIFERDAVCPPPPYILKYLRDLITGHVLGGKLTRCLTAIRFVRLYHQKEKNHEKECRTIYRACLLGWCVEILQASFLIADDIMDESLMRRGRPCRYLEKNLEVPNGTIGKVAINDAFLLQNLLFSVIKHEFSNDAILYPLIFDCFQENILKTELGQLLDLTVIPFEQSKFSLDHYHKIVINKTAYYSFFLPFHLAMLLSEFHPPHCTKEKYCNALEVARSILLPMGEFFQIQDDVLDCYGNFATIGKTGRDIEEAKCTWLVCQAIQLASPSQLIQLKQHYGKDTPEDVSSIKAIYDQLHLKTLFDEYERKTYDQLKTLIGKQSTFNQSIFLFLLARIFKRKK